MRIIRIARIGEIFHVMTDFLYYTCGYRVLCQLSVALTAARAHMLLTVRRQWLQLWPLMHVYVRMGKAACGFKFGLKWVVLIPWTFSWPIRPTRDLPWWAPRAPGEPGYGEIRGANDRKTPHFAVCPPRWWGFYSNRNPKSSATLRGNMPNLRRNKASLEQRQFDFGIGIFLNIPPLMGYLVDFKLD